ncbi:hypothetical protein FEM48_ZijujUnG0104400 [Ziziphus jujuba var. spinosa]|uniref:Uncharacterized protein n=1 Tax=Ziziphus jujuba var. spinosa TaxID=714518 RepID=A0A978U866_ZIZJJ|nr:hypothetical protein FEM48_ZijujUnG0104400 [Ziziphus jujuba var. spinosa]
MVLVYLSVQIKDLIGHGSYGGLPNQFQATEPHYHPPISGLQEQDFQRQPTCQLCHTYGHSAPYCYKRFDSQFMGHTTANSGYNSNFQYNPQPYVPSQFMGNSKLSLHSLKVHPKLFPTSPSSRSQAYNNNQNQSSQVPYSGYQKGSTSYSQPSTFQIQGNLAYTNVAS